MAANGSTIVLANETAVLAAGCFWCVETLFNELKGVLKVVSGYTGGATSNPTYAEVSSGKTGHAEAVEVTFDPGVISYSELLDIFWMIHDPTTLYRQGADVGTQYRSAIFYANENQKKLALKSLRYAQKHFASPIVTEVVKLDVFWPAEDYHQDYFANNRNNLYCRLIIKPKLKKFYNDYNQLLNK